MYELFPRLHERRIQRAGTMSGGEQQMLAIGRALMSQPRLLLLDEPSLGLAPIIIQQIFDTIEQLREQGMTIFLVEQNANQALKLADRGVRTGKRSCGFRRYRRAASGERSGAQRLSGRIRRSLQPPSGKRARWRCRLPDLADDSPFGKSVEHFFVPICYC